jgi:hypothetical protein
MRRLGASDLAFIGVDVTEVLHHLERAALRATGVAEGDLFAR